MPPAPGRADVEQAERAPGQDESPPIRGRFRRRDAGRSLIRRRAGGQALPEGDADGWSTPARADRTSGGDVLEASDEQPAYADCAPELAGADGRGATSFAVVATAFLHGREGAGPAGEEVSEGDRELCRRRFPGLLRAYQRDHGRICRSYFARHALAAAAVTSGDEVDLYWGKSETLLSPDYVRLLLRAEELRYAAWHRLHPGDRRLCQNMIFSVILEVLRRMDQQRQDFEARREERPARRGGDESERGAPTRPEGGDGATEGTKRRPDRVPAEALTFLTRQLDRAEDFMLRCAARRAQVRYTKGMARGLLVTLPLLVAIGALLSLAGVSPAARDNVLVTLGGGALGAVVSVLARMTFGSFSMNLPTLDHEMRQTDLRLIGSLRPAIGAVFGLVTFALLQSGLLPFDQGRGDATFLYLSIAFLAGFSERLAQDMFARSGQGLLGAIGNAPAHGPSAGLSPPPGRTA